MSLIEIANLSKSFGGFPAVSDVTLSIGRSEFVTFLGPSGCGKTTTLRLLAGFTTPDAGTIAIDGKILSSPGVAVPPERRRMGMVFQNYAIWPHMSLFDNVAFGLKLQGLRRRDIAERVARMLDIVGLSGLENRNPGQLSGGQQQRVALARSLVIEPTILLLDEPLSNLDAKLRERMRVEIKALQRRTGITFVYVTHDQAEALAMSDRIVVFRGGRVLQIGSPRDVYQNPANLFVADFMGMANSLEGKIVAHEGGILTVRIGRHALTATPAGAVTEGDVTVIVRPEEVILDPQDGPNRLQVTVIDVTFLGNAAEITLDLGGVVLRAQTRPNDARRPGDTLFVGLPVKACLAMAAAPGNPRRFDQGGRE